MKILVFVLFTTHIAWGQNVAAKIFGFRNSQCEQPSELFQLRTRIVTKDLSGKVLTVNVAARATCCVEFIPKIAYNNGTLHLDYEETGTPCECSCCYVFTYQLAGIEDVNTKITFHGKEIELSDEKYETYPIRFKILNGDTINYVDKYGLRQGVWVAPSDSLMTTGYVELDDDRIKKKVTLYPNGRLQRELMRDKVTYTVDGRVVSEYVNFNRSVEYYPSGQKKKECFNDAAVADNFLEKGKCKEWNERGELIYDGGYRE
ncbi:MAG TPA: hypothetical protein VG737_15125 [Cyclobacteriaceae bacterium]|nr:hypothetical protein [Cyclobacteriaceae bacterium]